MAVRRRVSLRLPRCLRAASVQRERRPTHGQIVANHYQWPEPPTSQAAAATRPAARLGPGTSLPDTILVRLRRPSSTLCNPPMVKSFCPLPRRFAVIRMDAVGMVKHYDDPIALAAAEAMKPKKYLVYLSNVSPCMRLI